MSLVFEEFIDLGIGWEERLEGGGGGWGEAISFLLQQSCLIKYT